MKDRLWIPNIDALHSAVPGSFETRLWVNFGLTNVDKPRKRCCFQR
jgi:hypothetical protein